MEGIKVLTEKTDKVLASMFSGLGSQTRHFEDFKDFLIAEDNPFVKDLEDKGVLPKEEA